MGLVSDFVGGAYQALSPAAGADQAINVFAETRRAEGSAKTRWLLGAPALTPFATGAGQGCRGWFSLDGRTFVVTGTTLYEVHIPTRVLTPLGTIPDNGEPVSFSSNGQGGEQLAIVGGDTLHIFDTGTNTLSGSITLPFAGPVMVVFIDGYFLINQRDSPVLWFSAIEDGTSWDALDFIARSGTADNLVGLGVAQSRIWATGTRTTTLFYNSGDADTPFLPYPGSVVNIGAVTPWALARRNDLFVWLAQDGTGTPRIVKATGGPAPTEISTAPIQQWLEQCPTLATAEILTYQQSGHAFFAITCPDSPDDIQTYVWDDTESVWSARAGWDSVTGRWTRWRARGSAQVEGLVLVGDYETAELYLLDLTAAVESHGPLRWLRRLPYLAAEPQWIFVDEIELLAEVGVGLSSGQGADPLVYLRLSRDAGQTWVSAGSASLGAIGAYGTRAIWRRLGRVRADRLVLEVSGSDPVARAFVGLAVRSTQAVERVA